MVEPELTLASALRALSAGELTPAELLEHCLRRASQSEDLGAWVCLESARAREAAREVERRGSSSGPLGGIPIGVKDNVDVAGLPTRWGSEVTSAAPVTADAAIVEQLRLAGAVVLGKTATHEITFGVTTRGVANPRDRARLAGGSSGGSAVAVAVGACLLAVGSDTAGSVRIPAALCGVAGLMGPRLPTGGIRPLAPSMDTAGLLCRTAEDLSLSWQALTGEAPAPAPVRIGVVAPECLGEIEPEVQQSVDAVLAQWTAAGVATVAVAVPSFAEFARARAVVIGAEALAVQGAAGAWPARAASFGEAVRHELARAEAITDEQLNRARGEQQRLASALRGALDGVDALAWPTTPQVAPLADDGHPPAVSDRRLAGVLTRLCGPVNAARLAAVTIPCGAGAHGLPVGLQLVARDESRALAAALAVETVISG